MCTHSACLNLSSAQLASQQKLHLVKIFLSHVLIYTVQHHPEPKSGKEKEQRDFGKQTNTGNKIDCTTVALLSLPDAVHFFQLSPVF